MKADGEWGKYNGRSKEKGRDILEEEKIFWGAFLILFGLSLIGGAWWISTRDIHQERIEDFIETEVQPELGKYSEKNKEASRRAIERIRTVFSQYRLGVDPFVEDIISIKSRLILAWYGISDLKDKAFGDEKLQEQGGADVFLDCLRSQIQASPILQWTHCTQGHLDPLLVVPV